MKTARRLCVLAVLVVFGSSTSLLAQGGCNFASTLTISSSQISVGESTTLSWCNPGTTGASGYVVTNFKVYGSQNFSGPYQLLRTVSNTTTSTSLTAGAIDAGKSFYLYVLADGCQKAAGTPTCTPASKQSNTVFLSVLCNTIARGVRSGNDDTTLRACGDATPFAATDILTFRWDPRNDVLGFQLELYSVSSSGTQTRILLTETGPTAAGARLLNPLPAGNYCFRVRGFQEGSVGKEPGEEGTSGRFYCDWSVMCCFSVAAPCPTAAPTAVAPVAASTVSSPVQFSWTGVASTTGYEVFVRRAGVVSSAGKTTATTLTGTLAPGAVEWWVEASFSGCPAVRSATIPFTVSAAPEAARIVLTAIPEGMLQPSGIDGATDRFSLTNVGGTAARVVLSGPGDFLSTLPLEALISPGQTVLFTLTAKVRPAGLYQADITASVPGQEPILIPVKLLAADPPAGPVIVRPEKNRVDVAAPPGLSPSGSVTFRNEGTQQLKGMVTADVPWLVPQRQTSEISIAPGSSAQVSFVIDRSKRPDGGDLVGSVNGTLALRFMTGTSPLNEGRFVAFDSPGGGSTLATATDTVRSAVSTASVPALTAGEIAWFVPGVGHVQGSGNRLFISDVSILNQTGVVLNDIRLYFVPRGTSSTVALSTAIDRLQGRLFTRYNDISQTIFSNSSTVGSLQIRTPDAARLSINANIFNTSNPAGSYGTTVPTFRSDRSTPPNDSLFITGLKAEAGLHTNLYLQETQGVTSTIDTMFLNASGGVTGQRSDILPPFELVQAGAVPAGTVSAIVSNRGNGKIAAYATPVDDTSNDTWAVADWRKVYQYGAAETVVIPIAGSTPGANNSQFRSDIAFFNAGTASGGTLRYFPRGGDPAQMEIVLPAQSTRVFTDIVGTLGRPVSIGYLTFTANSPSISLTSRAYTIVPGSTETYGTAVPALGSTSELRLGQTKRFGAVDDASIATVNARAGNTFRTNFGMVETTGNAVTVRVTLHYTFRAGPTATARGIASKNFDLQPRGFLLISNVSRELLGAALRDSAFGDLNDLQIEFEVITGTGAVIPFLTSTDNGTNDSILRTE